MSDAEHVDDPVERRGDGGTDCAPEAGNELTLEQEEALRRTMESIRDSLTPKITMPSFMLPESTLRNIAAISQIAETQQAMVASAIKPILDAQAARQKQFAVINSDIFKSHALAQSDLNLIASQLTKSIDFGIEPLPT